MLRIQKVTTVEEFRQLATVWDELLDRSAGKTIALTWDWLSAWWEVFGRDRELNILVVRDEDHVIAIAPLLKRTVQRYSFLPFCRLEFLASGEAEAEETCSPYLDFIISKGREPEAVSLIARYLREHDDDWDEILLAAMPAASPNLPLMAQSSVADSLNVQPVSTEPALYLELPDIYADFVDRLSPSLKREIRKDRRVAAAKGYRFRVIDDPGGFQDGFRTLIGLHQSRWTSRGEPVVFGNPRFRRFHELLAERILSKRWLKLFILEVAGEPIAALMAFTFGDRVILYQSGFRAGCRTLFHPGSAVRDMAIEWSIAEGYKEWDFLRTQPGSYKYRWTSQARYLTCTRVSRFQSKEIVYATASRVIDSIRHIRRALT